ncbi:hypothetical protein SAMN05444288_0618 [Hoylesella oralis]|nr:hypothetical protein SAMN05444288_0618 [Hoylesella oralis]
MQTEYKETCFNLLRRRLSYAKIVQTEYKETCFNLLRCRLFYAKIVQKSEIFDICCHYCIKKLGSKGPTYIESYKKNTHHAQ